MALYVFILLTLLISPALFLSLDIVEFRNFHLFTSQVSLLTDNGGTKDDLKLPTDDGLATLVIFLSFSYIHT